MGKLKISLQYLTKALNLEMTIKGSSLADTHLNICAVLS